MTTHTETQNDTQRSWRYDNCGKPGSNLKNPAGQYILLKIIPVALLIHADVILRNSMNNFVMNKTLSGKWHFHEAVIS